RPRSTCRAWSSPAPANRGWPRPCAPERRLGQGGFGFPAFAFATAYSTIASAAFTPTASRRPWNPGDALTSSTYGVVPRKIMSTPLISRPTAFDARTAIDFASSSSSIGTPFAPRWMFARHSLWAAIRFIDPITRSPTTRARMSTPGFGMYSWRQTTSPKNFSVSTIEAVSSRLFTRMTPIPCVAEGGAGKGRVVRAGDDEPDLVRLDQGRFMPVLLDRFEEGLRRPVARPLRNHADLHRSFPTAGPRERARGRKTCRARITRLTI